MLGNGFSIRDALAFGWNKTQEHLYLLIRIVLVIFALEVVLCLGFLPLMFFLQITQESYLSIIPLVLLLAYSITSVLLVISVVRLGVLRVFLDIYERNNSQVARLFSCSNLVFTYICALVLFSLIMLPIVTFMAVLGMVLPPVLGGIINILGLCLLIFLQTRFGFYMYPIVDLKMGVIDALTKSWRSTKGSELRLIIFNIIVGLLPAVLGAVMLLNLYGVLAVVSRGWYLAAIVPTFLVLVALFFLALLVPVIFLANVYVYKKLVEHTSNNNGLTSLHLE